MKNIIAGIKKRLSQHSVRSPRVVENVIGVRFPSQGTAPEDGVYTITQMRELASGEAVIVAAEVDGNYFIEGHKNVYKKETTADGREFLFLERPRILSASFVGVMTQQKIDAFQRE